MGLFTNPVVLNDGQPARTFSFRAQQPDNKSLVGDYIEDAAALAEESLLVVKHDLKATAPRHLLQTTIMAVPAAGTAGVYERITINTTVTAHKSFTVAEVTPQFVLHQDALAETDFLANFLTGKI